MARTRLKKGEAVAITVALVIAIGLIGVNLLWALSSQIEPPKPAEAELGAAIGNRVDSAERCGSSLPVAEITRYGSTDTMTAIDPNNLTNSITLIYADLDYPLRETSDRMDYNEDGQIQGLLNPFVEDGGGIVFATDTAHLAGIGNSRLTVLLPRGSPNRWEHLRMAEVAPAAIPAPTSSTSSTTSSTTTTTTVPTYEWRQWGVYANKARTCWYVGTN